MRLWSIHPKYLDTKGLLALWREGLLAKKVLEGKTKGYRNHPQLERFKKSTYPLLYLNAYLYQVYLEAKSRGYNFDQSKIEVVNFLPPIPVTIGQIKYEFEHLLNKLIIRDKNRYSKIKNTTEISVNPVFKIIPGEVEGWEKMNK
nr:pyrimidine dimer DNA glycosylase/endonuclease V [Carboxydothermus pertinax]